MKRLCQIMVCAALGACMVAAGVPVPSLAAEGSDSPAQSEAGDSTDAAQDGDAGSDSQASSEPSSDSVTVYTMNAKGKKGSWKYKTVKHNHKRTKVKVTYRFADGSYPAPITKIGSSVYYFKNGKGKLGTSSTKTRIVSVGGKRYCVSSSGKLLKGWNVKGGKLYYFGGPYHCAKTNCKKSGIKLMGTGAAKSNLDCELKIKCIKFLDKCCKSTDKKSVKLRKAWNYLTKKGRWHYTIYNVVLSDKTWAKRYAYTMLSNHHGDCYGFAVTFCAIAQEIGYEPKVVMCRVPGSRDHAADGYTHHGLLLINGRYFDPEAQFAGWARGIYNMSSYPMGIKSMHTKKFSSYDGSIAARYIYQSKPTKTKYLAVKKGGYYYGHENKATGPKITGVWCIGQKMYVFNSKGRMKVSSFKKLKKACARRGSWEALKKILGEPLSYSTASSCYGNGKDVIYNYEHAAVATFKPADGSKELIMSYRSN